MLNNGECSYVKPVTRLFKTLYPDCIDVLFFLFRNVSCWGLLLGLIAFVSSRIWFTSFVPAYSTYTWNSAVIAIGAAATIDKIISGNLPNQASTRIVKR